MASKAGGSGQGMERGRHDKGRRHTRPETEPFGGEWPLMLSFLNFNMHSKMYSINLFKAGTNKR